MASSTPHNNGNSNNSPVPPQALLTTSNTSASIRGNIVTAPQGSYPLMPHPNMILQQSPFYGSMGIVFSHSPSIMHATGALSFNNYSSMMHSSSITTANQVPSSHNQSSPSQNQTSSSHNHLPRIQSLLQPKQNQQSYGAFTSLLKK